MKMKILAEWLKKLLVLNLNLEPAETPSFESEPEATVESRDETPSTEPVEETTSYSQPAEETTSYSQAGTASAKSAWNRGIDG